MKILNIVIFGLSITSSWGNGHATTFRSLAKALSRRGHKITFFEKDVPWYAAHRDLPSPGFCSTILYHSLDEVNAYEATIAHADLVILGSYVADAEQLAKTISALSPACFAFYDIDTPVTLEALNNDQCAYLTAAMIPMFDVYLSFTGGPTLNKLEQEYGAQRTYPLYCSVDPELYFPETITVGILEKTFPMQYALGYLGTYSSDRQPTIEKLLLETARRASDKYFCVAGAQYSANINWPGNVKQIEHIPPHQHRHFYNSQQFTLNVTRRAMITAGYSPSVRLFEAGACGTPIISDYWEGLDSFFTIGEEILVAQSTDEMIEYLNMSPDDRLAIGRRMWQKIQHNHTSTQRAIEIEELWQMITAQAFTTHIFPATQFNATQYQRT
jgi:spore maturation protein CgeB